MKLNENTMIPMELQLFAEDATGNEDGGAAETSENTENTNTDNTGSQQQEAPKTFDDLLGNKEYQAEFDRRIQKALETQRSKLEVLFDEKATEADKLAKMSEKEKAQYQQQKQEKALAEREAAITRRELMAEAKNTLAEKKLPLGLCDVLTYTDAEICSKSIEAVEKAFNEAVAAGVEEQLKGGKPPKKAPEVEAEDLQKQVEKLMSGNI